MKKLLIFLAFAIVFVSCHKECEEEDIPKCPVITTESVPAPVIHSFKQKYPEALVDVWFKKDGVAYAALFSFSNQKSLAEFKADGTFIEAEAADEQGEIDNDDDDDDDDDNEDEENECECRK